MDALKYPIGQFSFPESIDPQQRQHWIAEIAEAPVKLREAVARLTPEQLDTPYRPDGWTVRQVVHHVPDSHMMSYTRFKLALTEHEPTISAYEEAAWADLADTSSTPVEVSLTIVDALHQRWVRLLKSLTPAQFARQFRHPALGLVPLEKNLALYAWHGKHHVAQIASLRERKGWN